MRSAAHPPARRAPVWLAALVLANACALAGTAAYAGAQRAQARSYPPGAAVRLHQRRVAVAIRNFHFVPATLVVSAGTQVVWTNGDSDPHTVDSTKLLWASEALDTGGHFSRAFTKAGTFPYYCSVHPFMHGTVIVVK